MTAWSGAATFVVLAGIARGIAGWPVLAAVPLAAVAAVLVTVALYWHGDRGGREYERRTDRVGAVARTFYLIVGRIPTDDELASLVSDRPVTTLGGHATTPRPVRPGPLPGGVRLLSIVGPSDGGNGGAA
ncbi:hypothetical protein [Pseudonocardia dioxanivorans]|uniref:hypothetical protein n=1 Tax=Pseudonocardia dioxanivorans TaxID=240495 RepID=UPI00030EB505|nr:hypothetical protein [Pseudonocardia dioxanivorans]